jgi:L-seryl-tRNA(Ser) seleniumtransferase
MPLLVETARSAIDEARRGGDEVDATQLARNDLATLAARRPRRMVNATGVLLHTNLGRAPLHPAAAAAASAVATGYANVEFDLTSGRRGGRHAYAGRLIASVNGAEAGLAVNNNAGALLLTLAAIAAPSGALVSRGELIEIGGSFRLPELMAASGARLIEVGTTNRTRLSDYERALADAAVVLKVHPANYRVEGFAESVGYADLARLSHNAQLPFIADVGSGLLDVRTPWLEGPPPSWLATEPGVRQTIEAGADLVLFSGDKLLGGPQAGIIAGRADLVDEIAGHPMMRALRLDGPTLAALTTTLELYGQGRASEIPFWRMVGLTTADLEIRLLRLQEALAMSSEIAMGESLPGAGSVPGETIPTPVLAIADHPDARWRTLLGAEPPVLARRSDDRLIVDLRTVDPADDAHVAAALG